MEESLRQELIKSTKEILKLEESMNRKGEFNDFLHKEMLETLESILKTLEGKN